MREELEAALHSKRIDADDAAIALQLLHDHLPTREIIVDAVSAQRAPGSRQKFDALAVLTERRFLYVTPDPYVLSWDLRSIALAEIKDDAFIVGREGIGADWEREKKAWLREEFEEEFAEKVRKAAAIARLSG